MKAVISIACALSLCASVASAELYARPASIVSVNHDEVVCIDASGDMWAFYGEVENSRLCLIMDDMGTETIYDDIIVDIMPIVES